MIMNAAFLIFQTKKDQIRRHGATVYSCHDVEHKQKIKKWNVKIERFTLSQFQSYI